jgi:HEAT repeat protein
MNGLIMMAVNTPKEERAELEGGAALFGEAIVPALIGYLTSDNDMTVRSTVSAILLRIGTPAIEPLTDELRAHRHGWQPLRSIIRLLGQLKAVNAEKNIFQYASHPHPKVREECLTALYEILGPDAEKYLVSFVQDPEKLVARRAITELALLHSTNTGYLDFVNNTIRVRNRNEDEPDETLQAVCLRALAEYHKVLMPKDPDIEGALTHILSTKGLKTLLPGRMGVRTKSAELRALAVYALAARGGEKNERLIEVLKDSDEPKVAEAANEAIKRIAEEHQVFSAPNPDFDPWASPVD